MSVICVELTTFDHENDWHTIHTKKKKNPALDSEKSSQAHDVITDHTNTKPPNKTKFFFKKPRFLPSHRPYFIPPKLAGLTNPTSRLLTYLFGCLRTL